MRGKFIYLLGGQGQTSLCERSDDSWEISPTLNWQKSEDALVQLYIVPSLVDDEWWKKLVPRGVELWFRVCVRAQPRGLATAPAYPPPKVVAPKGVPWAHVLVSSNKLTMLDWVTSPLLYTHQPPSFRAGFHSELPASFEPSTLSLPSASSILGSVVDMPLQVLYSPEVGCHQNGKKKCCSNFLHSWGIKAIPLTLSCP